MAETPPEQADGGSDSDESLAETCEACGARLDLRDWCPVVSTTDPDGTLRFYSFCDEACRRAWAGP